MKAKSKVNKDSSRLIDNVINNALRIGKGKNRANRIIAVLDLTEARDKLENHIARLENNSRRYRRLPSEVKNMV